MTELSDDSKDREILHFRDRLLDKIIRVVMPTEIPCSESERVGTVLALGECLCYLWLVCHGRTGRRAEAVAHQAARNLVDRIDGMLKEADEQLG